MILKDSSWGWTVKINKKLLFHCKILFFCRNCWILELIIKKSLHMIQEIIFSNLAQFKHIWNMLWKKITTHINSQEFARVYWLLWKFVSQKARISGACNSRKILTTKFEFEFFLIIIYREFQSLVVWGKKLLT